MSRQGGDHALRGRVRFRRRMQGRHAFVIFGRNIRPVFQQNLMHSWVGVVQCSGMLGCPAVLPLKIDIATVFQNQGNNDRLRIEGGGVQHSRAPAHKGGGARTATGSRSCPADGWWNARWLGSAGADGSARTTRNCRKQERLGFI